MLLYRHITARRLLYVPCGGILPNTGAANISTISRKQYLALTREDLTVTIDISTAGKASIKFGKGSVTASISTTQVSTEIRKINFKVLKAPTPFLLYLADIDRLNVYFNNTTDKLVQGEHRTLFTLKDNYYFNYKILINVIYLGNKPVLYVVNKSTAFQDAKFLSAISAKETWQALRIVEFYAKVKIMGSIGKTKRYYAPLRRAWDILHIKLASTIPNRLVLTLLVFRAYLRIITELPLLLLINRPASKDVLALPLQSESNPNALHALHKPPVDIEVPIAAQPRKRGHPPGLKNKRKANVYIIEKEEANHKLAIKLRNNRVITTLGALFKAIILAYLPLELVLKYLEGTLFYVIKPLYGIAEAGELDMFTSTYDPYLLVINGNVDAFRLISISQLGFILMLVNKSTNVNNTFTICGNIIHYSLTKCKRVTRSVLASKIYGMIIIERLGLPVVPLVICTDSYSLYKCLVKLRTTKEKRLIINIITLRQLYERREIIEI
ncbi:hypothetical protein BU23DRAFT_584014 [Bimuria novae-zelandiae CBS 107.79]|uniref:Uncharacterized protein n=1 Tax=Bimuria novae-zelandiae CBS 107.79 TaxID=1447943 RepID=A0A6A5V1J5_9PLEO|nr:hypothetical protein BU23DRAFT_584014 [Bimuria novae-zelandiae CBS 107.79]